MTIERDGKTFTSRYDQNGQIVATAEEVYQEWIDQNNQPQPLTEIEQLRLEMARSNTELFETILMLNGGA